MWWIQWCANLVVHMSKTNARIYLLNNIQTCPACYISNSFVAVSLLFSTGLLSNMHNVSAVLKSHSVWALNKILKLLSLNTWSSCIECSLILEYTGIASCIPDLYENAFHPIALASCLCKLMERMIHRRLLFVLEAKGLLSGQQSGFRKYRSTMNHLTNLEHCISVAFAKNEFMVGVFLDIHKAFDMTWRHGILMKLCACGSRGNWPIFVYNFLQDRIFSVKLPTNVFF